MKTYLGVDIGGTDVKLGLLDGQGRILRRASAPAAFDNYRTPLLDTVVRAVRGFLEQPETRPLGVGLSSTGCIDRAAGTIVGSWIPGWEGSRVAEAVEAATGLPVTLENDGNCMCLGECWTGAGAGFADLLCVAVGTGIGGSAVVGGQLLGGAHGLSLEIGHMVTHRGGEPCSCGRSGCWERYASTAALVRQARAAGLSCGNGRELLALVRDGDAAAQAVYDRWLDELAEGLRDLVLLLDPACILIGGGIAAAGETLLAPLRRKLPQGLLAAYHGGFELRAASLGNDAGITGAVRVLLNSGRV